MKGPQLPELFTSICFGSQFDCERHLVSGWSRPEVDFVWTDGGRSVLHIGKPAEDVDCRLEVTLSCFRSNLRPFQILRLAANGTWIASQIIDGHETTLSLFVSADVLARAGRLELVFDNLSPGRPIDGDIPSTDKRLLAFALRSVAIEPLSGAIPKFVALPPNLLGGDAETAERTALRRAADHEAIASTLDTFKRDRALPRLLEAHIRNLGASTDSRHKLVETVEAAIETGDVFDETKQVSMEAIERHVPNYRHLRFEPAQHVRTTTLFEATDNPFLDPVLGAHSLEAFRSRRRPSFHLHSLDDGAALIHPYRYLVCTRDGRAAALGANLKGMSRSALEVPAAKIDRPLVVLQDYFDGRNISHFLLDSITRLFHFSAACHSEAAQALYFFGGIPTELHRLVLVAAADILGLRMDQFYFPSEERVVQAPVVHWFSDQALFLHPAQWMHPSSLTFLDRLASHMAFPTGQRRLYISRSDAPTRRIRNEAALFEALRPRGFEFVRLADLVMAEQMALVASAASIVAPHGMGLTHLVFNRANPRLIEIFHPEILSPSYALLAKARGLHYDAVFGATDGGDTNYDVDPAAILALDP